MGIDFHIDDEQVRITNTHWYNELLNWECRRILKFGGYLIYAIGNSTVWGTHFRTDKVFAGICDKLDLNVIDRIERPYYAYRMPRDRNVQSNTIKADVFIIAQK